MISEEIFTSRLHLRPLQDEDAEDIWLIRSNAEVNRYIERPKSFTLEESRAFIKKIEANWKAGRSFYWGIRPLSHEKTIGTICIWNINDDRTSAEIGYELLPAWQGKGLMKEAVRAVIRFCFENTTITELWGVTHFENEASVSLLRKNNFAYDADKKEENPNLHFYCLRK